jgi:molybdopterin synthase catalytic subunit
MKYVEIISLRASNSYEQTAHKYMKKICKLIKKYDLSEAIFFVSDSIPSDSAIFIISNSHDNKYKDFKMKDYFIDVLKQFGLVDYNRWRLVE